MTIKATGQSKEMMFIDKNPYDDYGKYHGYCKFSSRGGKYRNEGMMFHGLSVGSWIYLENFPPYAERVWINTYFETGIGEGEEVSYEY